MQTPALGLALLFCNALAAQGSILYVDENATDPVRDGTTWCRAFHTLHDGIKASTAGDTIRVAGGLYTPWAGVPGDVRTASFALKSGVRIEGAYAGCGAVNPDARDYSNDTSYIRGDPLRDDTTTGDTSNNSFHVLTASLLGPGTVIDGLYIDGGHATNPALPDGLNGAGMLAVSSTLTVINCIFQANEAQEANSGVLGRGGAVYARNCTLTFVDSLFRECIAGEEGGGVYSEASDIAYIDTRFEACITAGRGGGSLNDAYSSVTAFGCSFTVCAAGAEGGSMCNLGASVLVARSVFHGSSATDGGAVFNKAAESAFVNCRFEGQNQASRNGGCIFDHGSTTSLTNCLLVGNIAVDVGGAIHHEDAKLRVTNCTIVGNASGSGAGGIELLGSAGGEVTNSILWGNTSNGVSNESAQVRVASGAFLGLDYSDVQGLTGTLGGIGNIGLDPQFVAPGSGDYRLGFFSPCRNTGDNASLPADIADLDLDGNVLEATPLDLDLQPRIRRRNVDMGAYERS